MKSSGNIRQRSDGTFEINYSLGFDMLTGKRRRIYKTFSGTRDDAKKELRRLLRSVDTGEHVAPNKIKVSEFLSQWLETIRSQLSPKTHERYTEIIHHFLIPKLGHSSLTQLSPAAIQTAYNNWEIAGRRDGKPGGLAPRTRLHMHRILNSALRDAVHKQLIVRNPADFVKAARPKKVLVNVLTLEQSATLLHALRGSRLYWAVLIALTTGMRRGEICALRWKNVSFEKSTVRVLESLEQTKTDLRFKAPKTERTRAIVLPNYAVEELKVWKQEQAYELAKSKLAQSEDTLVYCLRGSGDPMPPRSLTHEFIKAIGKVSGIPRIRFHDLRHSHATQLLTEGIHPKIAQERLGHSTITTTLDLYSHVTDTMQNEAAEKLDAALRRTIKRRHNGGPPLKP